MRLALLMILELAFLAPSIAGESEDPVRTLTLLHTNDIHARLLPDDRGRGGFAYLAAAIRRECESSAGCIVLDGGDLVQGTPVSSLYRGLPIFELASQLGLHVSTLGNHEFDYGWEMIPKFIEASRFPIVTANVVDDEGRLLGGLPWVVLHANGLRVGVIGVLTRDLPLLTTADRIGPWRVLPVVETVERYLPRVAEQSDLVVVVGHLIDEEERAILSRIEDVAVVIAGHGHAGMQRPLEIDGRIAVRVEAYGRKLGRLDMRVDRNSGKVIDWSWKTIAVDGKRFEPDPRVARAVAEWEARVAERVDVPIGRASRRLSHAEVRSMLEQALREQTGADLAYVNRGGIRDVLPAGPLLARHIWNIMPFENRVLTGTIKGRDLPRFFTDGKSLDPDRDYRFATTDFTVTTWRERQWADLKLDESGPLLRDLVIDWIRERRVVH